MRKGLRVNTGFMLLLLYRVYKVYVQITMCTHYPYVHREVATVEV